MDFGEEDISTEAETKRQRRSRCARISGRLVPLARIASASIDFLVATTVERSWSRLSTMVYIIQNEDYASGVPLRFLNSVALS